MDDTTVAVAACQLTGSGTSHHTRFRLSQIATVAVVHHFWRAAAVSCTNKAVNKIIYPESRV